MDGNSYLILPGQGKEVRLHDLLIVHKITGDRLRGSLSVVEHVIQPRVLVKPHRHTREDEISIVLSGTVWARVGSVEVEAPAGSYLLKPRDVPHAIWNMGPAPSRVAEIVSPAGFERYFDEIEPVMRERGPEWTRRFAEVAELYGVISEDDWSTELQQKYGIHL
jgi:quercetin dioxygenase-like cupin family protein